MTTALVARLDSAGDVLLAGPAVRAVAASADRVVFLCSPAGRSAAQLLPGIDSIVTFEAPWVPLDPPAFDPATTLALVGHISAAGIDEALILTSFHQSPLPLALLLRLARVRRIAAICSDHPGRLLDVRHHVPDDIHEVERNLSVAATLGHRLPEDDDGRLRIRRETDACPVELPAAPYVVVHPGAAVPARAWSPARHAELVARLEGEGWRVVVTGSPLERDLCARIVAASRSGAGNLAGRTSLAALGEVLAGARAVVVGNTGPAHLAAAVGTPVVSLYAPTVPPTRWRPWGVPHVLLGNQDITCRGCRARRCPFPDHPCLDGIAVADIVTAVESLTAARSVAA